MDAVTTKSAMMHAAPGKERKGKERKGKDRKGKERKDYTFERQFNEMPSIILGCCMLHHVIALLCTHAWLHTSSLAKSARERLFVTPRHVGEYEHTHVSGGQLSMSSSVASWLLAGAALYVSRGSDVQQAAC